MLLGAEKKEATANAVQCACEQSVTCAAILAAGHWRGRMRNISEGGGSQRQAEQREWQHKVRVWPGGRQAPAAAQGACVRLAGGCFVWMFQHQCALQEHMLLCHQVKVACMCIVCLAMVASIHPCYLFDVITRPV